MITTIVFLIKFMPMIDIIMGLCAFCLVIKFIMWLLGIDKLIKYRVMKKMREEEDLLERKEKLRKRKRRLDEDDD